MVRLFPPEKFIWSKGLTFYWVRLETVVQAVCGCERRRSALHQGLCWDAASFQLWQGRFVFLKRSWKSLAWGGLICLWYFGFCCRCLVPPRLLPFAGGRGAAALPAAASKISRLARGDLAPPEA